MGNKWYAALLFFVSVLLAPMSGAAQDQQSVAKLERTCALIKPDAVAALRSGDIISLIELNGFKIVGLKKMHLLKHQAETFYRVHVGKPFFVELIAYISSGPLIAMALEKVNAIADWRTLMGATDPKKATVGTMRKMFGTNVTNNAVHGSDSLDSARQELAFFFPGL